MDNEIFKKGLTTKQAEKLLGHYGQNEIKEEVLTIVGWALGLLGTIIVFKSS